MIGSRIKQERIRLKKSQTDFGEGCGVTKNTQILYEKGERYPDSNYLQRAHLIGANVAYIITGAYKNEAGISEDESWLLGQLRALSDQQYQMVMLFLKDGLKNFTK